LPAKLDFPLLRRPRKAYKQSVSPAPSDPGVRARELAALAGEPFALDWIAAAGVDEEAIEPLLTGGEWLETGEGRARFADASAAASLRDAIPWTRRRRLHRELAAAAARLGLPPRLVATQLRQGGRQQQACAAFLQAAREAERHQRHDQAVAALREALELMPGGPDCDRPTHLAELARVARRAHDLDTAARAMLDLTLEPEVAADPARLGAAWRELASIRELAGEIDQALEARRQALAAFRSGDRADDTAAEAYAIAETLTIRLQLGAGLHAAEEAIAAARAAADPELESMATSLAGLALAMAGQAVEARRRIEAGLALALRHGSKEAASVAYQRLPYVHGYVADYHGHCDATRDALDFCRREAIDSGRRACLACMAWAMLRTGDWNGAERSCREALAGDDDGSQRMIADSVRGIIAALRGRLKSARQRISASEVAARRFGIAPMELINRAGLALVDSLDGRHTEAARRYAELLAFWEHTEDRIDILFGAAHAVSFFADQGDRRALGAWDAVIQRCAAANGNPESLGCAAFAAGEIARLEGHPALAAEQFRQAREAFARSDLALDLARCDLRAGLALLAADERAAAIESLRRAHRQAKALGARPLLAEIEARLAAVGSHATEDRRRDAPGRESRAGLTRRQQEVAECLARGLTNKEIAAELGLSTRTIDMHVAHVFDRLNCRSRAEAARRLVELGILEGHE